MRKLSNLPTSIVVDRAATVLPSSSQPLPRVPQPSFEACEGDHFETDCLSLREASMCVLIDDATGQILKTFLVKHRRDGYTCSDDLFQY
jgi:hypothetical protein